MQGDTHSKFTGLAGAYASARPTYPADSIDAVCAWSGLTAPSLIVDVGCGTGISTRLFAERGYEVIGIEPNLDMRKKAESDTKPGWRLKYIDGSAEVTALESGIADLVVAAQAFHWFNPEPTLTEFKRILKPHGCVALIWNERMESDPFTLSYGNALRRWAKDTQQIEGTRQSAAQPFLKSPLFADHEELKFDNFQLLSEQGVLDRIFSTSYAPKEGEARQALTAELKEIFARHQQDGRVCMHYLTTVYLGKMV